MLAVVTSKERNRMERREDWRILTCNLYTSVLLECFTMCKDFMSYLHNF